jgi:hypothetical protein
MFLRTCPSLYKGLEASPGQRVLKDKYLHFSSEKSIRKILTITFPQLLLKRT